MSRLDKDGVRTWLSWERTLWKVPDQFVSHTVAPKTSTGKANGKEGCLGDRKVPVATTWRLWGAHRRLGDSCTRAQVVIPKTSPETPKCTTWRKWERVVPDTQLRPSVAGYSREFCSRD